MIKWWIYIVRNAEDRNAENRTALVSSKVPIKHEVQFAHFLLFELWFLCLSVLDGGRIVSSPQLFLLHLWGTFFCWTNRYATSYTQSHPVVPRLLYLMQNHFTLCCFISSATHCWPLLVILILYYWMTQVIFMYSMVFLSTVIMYCWKYSCLLGTDRPRRFNKGWS